MLDKPAGLTSNAALQKTLSLLQAEKGGHTGSLDPLATGVLPLCLGVATRFAQYLLNADKRYLGTFSLGAETDTADADGVVTRRADAGGLDAERVRQALARFVGEISQVPPMYSAIKRQGVPLYKLARQGETVERVARTIHVHRCEMTDFTPGEQASVSVDIVCSKGTYIRTIAEDLGSALGCGGHLAALRRAAVGDFTLDNSITLDGMGALKRGAGGMAAVDALLLPSSRAVGHLPKLLLSEANAHYLMRGQPVRQRLPETHRGPLALHRESDDGFLGVGEGIDDGRIAPKCLVRPDAVTGGREAPGASGQEAAPAKVHRP